MAWRASAEASFLSPEPSPRSQIQIRRLDPTASHPRHPLCRPPSSPLPRRWRKWDQPLAAVQKCRTASQVPTPQLYSELPKGGNIHESATLAPLRLCGSSRRAAVRETQQRREVSLVRVQPSWTASAYPAAWPRTARHHRRRRLRQPAAQTRTAASRHRQLSRCWACFPGSAAPVSRVRGRVSCDYPWPLAQPRA